MLYVTGKIKNLLFRLRLANRFNYVILVKYNLVINIKFNLVRLCNKITFFYFLQNNHIKNSLSQKINKKNKHFCVLFLIKRNTISVFLFFKSHEDLCSRFEKKKLKIKYNFKVNRVWTMVCGVSTA